MLVYRVEHKESGIGPYHVSIRDNFMSLLDKHGYRNAYCDRNHPSPMDEPNLRFIYDGYRYIERDATSSILEDLIFGFRSLDQLVNWFYAYNNTVIAFLKEKGYIINIYDVEDGDFLIYNSLGVAKNIMYVEHGEKQCIFYKKVANLVDSIEL